MTNHVKKIRLLIADDHRVLLEGLVTLLQAESNFIITATAENGRRVTEILEKKEVDICLLDISMPDMDGIAAARWILEHRPAVKVIILTTHDEEEIIAEMIHIGVSGYLMKTSTRQELVAAINRVMSGRSVFSDEVTSNILEGYAKKMAMPKEKTGQVILTQREKEIVQLLTREYTNDKIAEELHISYRTVETHRKNIMQKTNAHNLAGLIKFAYSKGLLK
jgi:DNA-binding NarL/FixJ family response regulator